MIRISTILDIRKLEQYFLYANTPLYLYSNFQSQECVVKVSVKFSTKSLLNLFSYLYKKENKSLHEHVTLYGIIIALTLKPNTEVKRFFEALPKMNLKWAQQLAEIYLSRVRVDNTTEFDLTIKLPSNSISITKDSSSPVYVNNL